MSDLTLFINEGGEKDKVRVDNLSAGIKTGALHLAQQIEKRATNKYWIRHYEFYGENKAFFENKNDRVICISGPAETGKTLAALALIFKICIENNNARVVVARKVREDMANTVIQALRDDIITQDEVYYYKGQLITGRLYGGEKATRYCFSNGSTIFFVGLDKPGKVLSGAFNLIYINQAEETTMHDYQLMTTRITGRGTVELKNMPNKLILDCNPDASDHYIMEKVHEGEIKIYYSSHRDNPSLYNQLTGKLTEQGKVTINILKNLKGIQRERYYMGRWVMGEGVFFKHFDPAIHGVSGLADTLDLENMTIRLGYDYGFNHHSVVIFSAISGEFIYTFDEIAVREKYPEEIAKLIIDRLDFYGISVHAIKSIRTGHDSFAKTGRGKKTVVEMFREQGIRMTRAYTAPGSRAVGATVFLQWLGRPEQDTENIIEPVWFYDIDNCPNVEKAFLKLVYDPRNSEDIKKIDDIADDTWDALRYCLVTSRTLKRNKTRAKTTETIKAEIRQRRKEKISSIKRARKRQFRL